MYILLLYTDVPMPYCTLMFPCPASTSSAPTVAEVTGTTHMGHILPLGVYSSVLWTWHSSIYLGEISEMKYMKD